MRPLSALCTIAAFAGMHIRRTDPGWSVAFPRAALPFRNMDLVGGGVSFARELRERGERQRANADARVKHRLAIKEQMQEDFAPMYRGEVEAEVLIRDADRQPDGWPDGDWKCRWRRLSPWFKVGVMRPYANGMTAVLRLDQVLVDGDIARSQTKHDEEEGELVRVVGRIPYEAIVAIDRDGDGHFSGPHVYCHFDHGHKPYAQILVYREHSDSVWLPWEGVKYRPQRLPLWRRFLWHRESKKRQRQFECERREYMAEQERRHDA